MIKRLGTTRLAKARSHALYCDERLNTEHVVYLNIYQNFVLSAMKMHGYFHTWGLDVGKSTQFILSKLHTALTRQPSAR
jgi:telomerase reverse transcriptase